MQMAPCCQRVLMARQQVAVGLFTPLQCLSTYVLDMHLALQTPGYMFLRGVARIWQRSHAKLMLCNYMIKTRHQVHPASTEAFRYIVGASLLLVVLSAAPAHAYVVNIAAGTRALYLQVGAGTFTGGPYSAGGTPGNNPTINSVSVTVPPANIGAGPLPMTTDSTVTNSSLDNFVFCTVPAQVYVAGFFRAPGGASVATLNSTSPASLTNGADAIPFTSISWVSGGNGDATATIPSGTFNGATQTIYNAAQNTWFESCLSFVYANSNAVPAGTFSGRVIYTLSAP